MRLRAYRGWVIAQPGDAARRPEMYRAKRGTSIDSPLRELPVWPAAARARPVRNGRWIETTLIFHQGLDLPAFAAFVLLADGQGTEDLRRYYAPYVELAREQDLGLVLESPTGAPARAGRPSSATTRG